MDKKEFLNFLLSRFKIERGKFDRSGVYAYTQRLLAYNSNKIEGSTLTEEQTASLFDNGTLPKSDDYYRAKDVEEMNGHFLMFNKMLDTLDECPMAYKSMDDIINNIGDTVDIVNIIKPIYNFKAGGN